MPESLATRFWVVVPARLHSTRLPNKPLADIAGLPMVVRVAHQAAQSAAHHVVVATDHADIVQACAAHGVTAYLTSADHPSGTDRLAEMADLLNLPDEAIVVNVQGDEPLIDPALIDQLASLMAEGTAPMATLAHPIFPMPVMRLPTARTACRLTYRFCGILVYMPIGRGFSVTTVNWPRLR